MNTKEFCQLWNASNGRKAMANAIRAEHGAAVIDDVTRAVRWLNSAQESGNAKQIADAQAAFDAATWRRLDAERQVRFKYGLPSI